MANNRRKWHCLDCGKDCGSKGLCEHYFIHTNLWMQAVGSNKGMLCVQDLEKRLGRQLTPADFTDCHINDPKKNTMSPRLLSRIRGKIHA